MYIIIHIYKSYYYQRFFEAMITFPIYAMKLILTPRTASSSIKITYIYIYLDLTRYLYNHFFIALLNHM